MTDITDEPADSMACDAAPHATELAGNAGAERIASRCVCCGGANLDSSPAILMPFVAHRVFGWRPVFIDESWGLKTIERGTAYSICNSLICKDCGLLFLDIRFSDAEMARLYSDYRGTQYNSLRDHYEPGYTERNDALNSGIRYLGKIEAFLAPFVQFPLDLLDWGGDTGRNTPFKDQARTFDVYDISAKTVIQGASLVSREEAFAKRYDLIVCSNVLEHVPYPRALLADIARAMHESTLLYIEVPFEELMKSGEPDPHLKKRHWHEHINFYSQDSVARLLDACGLVPVAVQTLEVDAGFKSASLLQVGCKRRREPRMPR